LRSYGFGLVTLPIWTSIHTVKGDVKVNVRAGIA